MLVGAAILLVVICIARGSYSQAYYVLDGFGGVHAGGFAPAISPPTPYFGFDIAKDAGGAPPYRRLPSMRPSPRASAPADIAGIERPVPF